MTLMLEVGPNIAEISRQSGIPMETVRYLYREHIIRRRIRIQRELDHAKLGLKGIQFMLTLKPDVEPLFRREALFANAWQEVYITSIYRAIPDNLFFFNHMAPPALHEKLTEFYQSLEHLGVVKVHQTYDCARLTHPRMWVESFNPELPGWDFDWSSLMPPENIEDSPAPESVKFDKVDLLLIKEFEYQHDQAVAEVAAKNRLTRPVAFWHFRKHVDGRGIFGKYLINWLGTHRDSKSGAVPIRQSFLAISFIAKNLSPEEMMNVRAHLHSIPYLWSEIIGTADYNAETLIPAHSLMEAFAFFAKILRPLEGRARIFTVDMSCSSTYTIHPHLFDEDSHQWIYRGNLLLEGIRQAVAADALDKRWKKKEEGERDRTRG